MKILFLTSACVVVIATQALACRGTAEYPQASTQLENADLLSEHKTDLMEQLRQLAARTRYFGTSNDATKEAEEFIAKTDEESKVGLRMGEGEMMIHGPTPEDSDDTGTM